MGKHEDRTVEYKEPDEIKEVKNMLNVYKNYLGIKEPRSNRGIQPLVNKSVMEA